jgi:type III secretory pathway lipoprotein EscJ
LEIAGQAVKTSNRESESELKERKTITHNSVFAAHRLQCRMTIRKIDIRHFVFGAMGDVAAQNLLSL